jgi:hypothetical protein
MQRALIVLMAALMAAPAFAQGPGPASSPIDAVGVQPVETRPAGLTISPAALREAVGGQTANQQEWQRQYDAAKARQKRGQKKIYIGLGLGIGGTLVMVSGMAYSMKDGDCGESCGSSSAAALVGIGAASAVGGGLIWWRGTLDRAAANGSISTLEATKPTVAASQTIILTDHQALRVSVGARTSIGYRLAW